jgi:hypothetical protein
MTKKIMSVLLTLALIIVTIPALAAAPSITLNDLNQAGENNTGSAQSPTLSMTLNNLNQVTEVVAVPSPTLSMTLGNLNQVTGIETGSTQSPTLSMTLNNLNQVAGIVSNPALSPTLSMTLNNLSRFIQIEEYSVPLAGLFTIKDKLTDDAQAEFDPIAAYVDKGQAAIGYFGADISKLVLNGKLSSDYLGLDLSALILSEYVSLGINNYQDSGVDISATFGFASEYREGQTVIAMFGYKDKNGSTVWHALNTVAKGGQVKIDFPSELLLKAGSEAILGILS